MSRLLPTLAGAAAAALLAGCGGTGSTAPPDGRLEVTAAFYPLQFAAEQVGGDRVHVTSLTKPGAEPHDLELTARAVGRMASSDAVVYLKGFQPAVDEAVASEAAKQGLDVTPAAHLDLAAVPEGHDHGDGSEGGHQPETAGTDPHFWLDPSRYADVAELIAARFAAVDPAHAQEYRQRATNFTGRLHTLDAEFTAGLKDCSNRELVTSHTAFGYLAEAYGLHQEGITGLTPESEPDPAALARVARFVTDEGVRTVYAETLASRDVSETLARETGARLEVLDPIEGLTSQSAGKDYFEVMQANLATLRAGQGCR